ncbi:hypothetical protein HOLleu_42593 [Holothuria leucospilota]|uniref:Uncharacterized protein n=1 Tax=Holothuria leucospilota TaxID=206669 RepID=A0A9Q0YAE2_HOLLE|nr:hypothetical protein HOLleu_42593 [Holothuria leucospilota]
MSDPHMEAPLTPNHLETMESSSPLPPPGNFVKEDLYARETWRGYSFSQNSFGHFGRESMCRICIKGRNEI